MTTPPTEQQLDEIETRADARRTALSGWINCYSPLSEQETLEDAEAVLGKDVPALFAEVRRLRAEMERRTEDVAFLERTTLPELRRETEHHKDGKQRWRGRAETAEARVAELAAVHAFLDEQERAARLFELPTPAWVEAVRAASVPPAAPLSPVQHSSVSESAQSPTGAPEGALGASGSATPLRRTLTPNEYDAAWHAVEGAAGDEGADPGTVVRAVLDRLGIEWQDAARPA